LLREPQLGYLGGNDRETLQFARPPGHRLPAGVGDSPRRLREPFRHRPRIPPALPLVRLRRRRSLLRDFRLHYHAHASRLARPAACDPRLPFPPVLARLSAVLADHVVRSAIGWGGAQFPRGSAVAAVADPDTGRIPQYLRRHRVDARVRNRLLRRVRAVVRTPSARRTVRTRGLGHRDCHGVQLDVGDAISLGDIRRSAAQPADYGIPLGVRDRCDLEAIPPALRAVDDSRRRDLGNLLGRRVRGAGSTVRSLFADVRTARHVRHRLGVHRLWLHRRRARGDVETAAVAAIHRGRFVLHLPLARPDSDGVALQSARLAAPYDPAFGVARVHAAGHLGRRDARAPLGRTAAVALGEAALEGTRCADLRSPRVTSP